MSDPVQPESDRECICGHNCECPTFKDAFPDFEDDPVAMALGFTALKVKALRDYAQWAKRKEHSVLASLLNLAADEIERLRAKEATSGKH